METGSDVTFISTLLPFAGIVFIIAIGVVLLNQQFRKNLYRQQLEQEELKNRHQLDLLRSNIESQELERKRIAQDLHDELGAILSITRMQLMQVERKFGPESEQLLTELKEIRGLTENSLESMRRISHELMPPVLERFGLLKALEAIAEKLNEAGAIRIHFVCSANLSLLSKTAQLMLYRVFMELINNTMKHAQAERIDLHMETSEETLCCSYADNGKGLDYENLKVGLGHKSMEGRLSSIGGSMEFGNTEKGNFYAKIQVPFQILAAEA